MKDDAHLREHAAKAIVSRFDGMVNYEAVSQSSRLRIDIQESWFDGDSTGQGCLRWLQDMIRISETGRSSECFPRLHEIERREGRVVLHLSPMRQATLEGLLCRTTALPTAPQRRQLWRGFARVARSLDRLHQLGYLHRSLTAVAILADQLEDPDSWLLSGFESLMRIGDRPPASMGSNTSECGDLSEGFSPSADWLNFLSSLYRAMTLASPDWSLISLSSVAPQLSEMERGFFSMLGRTIDSGQPLTTLDIPALCVQVERSLAASQSSPRRLLLKISRDCAKHAAEVLCLNDTGGLGVSAAIAADLSTPRIIWSGNQIRGDSNLLVGKRLAFAIRSDERSRVPWEVAYSDALMKSVWMSSASKEISELDRTGVTIEVDVVGSVRKSFDGFASWSEFIVEPPKVNPFHARYVNFLALTNAIDAMYRYQEIVRVSGVQHRSGRIYRVFLGDLPGEPGQLEYALSNLRRLNEACADPVFVLRYSPEPTPVTFSRDPAQQARDQHAVADFCGDGQAWIDVEASPDSQLVSRKIGYLRAPDHRGQISLIDRRRNAFASLAEQPWLLERMAAPDRQIKGALLEDPEAHVKNWLGGKPRLDESKLQALSRIFVSANSMAVRGPPGSGKTQLLAGLVKCILAVQPYARILVTAQAQSAVAVMKKRIEDDALQFDRDIPILMRPQLRDHVRIKEFADFGDPSIDGAIDPESQAAIEEIQDHIQSLASQTDAAGRRLLLMLLTAFGRPDVKRRVLYLRDAAAPIVFCSSTAGELVELTQLRETFDWVVVEEAARAHAHDLTLPLGLSARWVFIGDERQLAPFRAQDFASDIADISGEVKERFGRMQKSRWGKYLPEGALIEGLSSSEIAVWMSPFRAFHRAGQEQPLTLKTQYRMASTICEMVSDVFYKDVDGISTDGSVLERDLIPVATWAKPFERQNGPEVIWSVVSWAQEGRPEAYMEQRLTAPREVDRVTQILRALRSDGRPVEVAVLSPYSKQVSLMHKNGAFRLAFKMMLSQMATPGLDDEERVERLLRTQVATVDSFQGREADIVIVSLVRNNLAKDHWGPVNGFLNEPERVNVMLSRARRQLIVVGAWGQFSNSQVRHWQMITRTIADGSGRGLLQWRHHQP